MARPFHQPSKALPHPRRGHSYLPSPRRRDGRFHPFASKASFFLSLSPRSFSLLSVFQVQAALFSLVASCPWNSASYHTFVISQIAFILHFLPNSFLFRIHYSLPLSHTLHNRLSFIRNSKMLGLPNIYKSYKIISTNIYTKQKHFFTESRNLSYN